MTEPDNRIVETWTISLNGGLTDVWRREGDEEFTGRLQGEEDDGTLWEMAFWLPEDAVAELVV